MITLIFEAHGTTYENEAKLYSSWNDIGLSPLGMKQSGEMGDRYKDDHFDAIFTSDLQRAYMSAEIGFVYKDWPIIKDKRLRECNLGDYTQHDHKKVFKLQVEHINEPFPNGESYEDTSVRMKSFLEDLLRDYKSNRVMVIGHRATQFGIEHWVNGKSYKELTTTPFKWQPSWEYRFEKLVENSKPEPSK